MMKESEFKLWLLQKMSGAKSVLEFIGEGDDPRKSLIQHELDIYKNILHRFMGVAKDDQDTESLLAAAIPQRRPRRKKGDIQ